MPVLIVPNVCQQAIPGLCCEVVAVGMPVARHHWVARGGHPPPAPSERSVQISRTTLFRNRFTAQRVTAVPYREAPILVAAKENEP